MSPHPASKQQRILKIPGTANLRDLGGYPLSDGRRVKWRLLYRSSHLGDLSPRGLQEVSGLNLKAVVDFRSTPEAERKPNRLPDGIPQIKIPIQDVLETEIATKIPQRIRENDFQDFDPQDYILQAYRQFATSFTPQFKDFFQVVKDAAGLPVLWNCAAGKDRTGFASAVLLRVLGVGQEVIFHDYLLSNRHGRSYLRELASLLLFRGWEVYQKVKPLTGVDRRWLAASFAMIDQEWGDFGSYARKGLGLTDSDIEGLQAALLEWPG